MLTRLQGVGDVGVGVGVLCVDLVDDDVGAGVPADGGEEGRGLVPEHRLLIVHIGDRYHERRLHNIWKKGNVLFNDALNSFYLQLYGVGHMVKDHSDSERGNPLLPHGLLFPISSKGSFICTIPQTG